MLRLRTMTVTVVGALVCASVGVAAHGRAPGTPAQKKAAAVTVMTVGTQRFTFNDEATCAHQSSTTIFGMQVEMWGARLAGNGAQASVQVYRPKDGSPEMFSLYFKTPGVGRSYRVSTATRPGGAGGEGSGNAKLTPAGSGVVLAIDGVSADGTRIAGTITCAAFTE